MPENDWHDRPIQGRRSIRIPGFDYAHAGAYFITLCTHRQACLFGSIVQGQACLSTFGEIVKAEWLRTAQVRPHVTIDLFVIMPNHLHGVIVITDHGSQIDKRATDQVAPAYANLSPSGPSKGSIGAIIGQFKTATTKRINALRGTPGAHVWQRNYYEHVVRNDRDLERIATYIAANPEQWDTDPENPNSTSAPS